MSRPLSRSISLKRSDRVFVLDDSIPKKNSPIFMSSSFGFGREMDEPEPGRDEEGAASGCIPRSEESGSNADRIIFLS